jgi:hypothetical protein
MSADAVSADAVSDAELNATSRNTAQTITPESPLEFLDRMANGQNCRLILSSPWGALHGEGEC